MGSKTDIELIRDIKSRLCDDSMRELTQRHGGLCSRIFSKYARFFGTDYQRFQDLLDDRDLIVCRAVETFDESKNVQFNTWLGNRIRYECLNALNRRAHLSTHIPMELRQITTYIDKYNATQGQPVDQTSVDYVFTLLGQIKDKRIEDIFRLRYLGSAKNTSWADIGKKMNISTQTVINLHDKGKTLLSRKLNSEECFDGI